MRNRLRIVQQVEHVYEVEIDAPTMADAVETYYAEGVDLAGKELAIYAIVRSETVDGIGAE